MSLLTSERARWEVARCTHPVGSLSCAAQPLSSPCGLSGGGIAEPLRQDGSEAEEDPSHPSPGRPRGGALGDRTEVDVQEGCVGTFHEDILGGAMQRLVHEVDAVPHHGPDALGKALRGTGMWGGDGGERRSQPHLLFPQFLRVLVC